MDRCGRDECSGERHTGAGGRLSRQPVGAGKGRLLRTPGAGPRAAPASGPPVSGDAVGTSHCHSQPSRGTTGCQGREEGQPRQVSPEATQETSDAECARRDAQPAESRGVLRLTGGPGMLPRVLGGTQSPICRQSRCPKRGCRPQTAADRAGVRPNPGAAPPPPLGPQPPRAASGADTVTAGTRGSRAGCRSRMTGPPVRIPGVTPGPPRGAGPSPEGAGFRKSRPRGTWTRRGLRVGDVARRDWHGCLSP